MKVKKLTALLTVLCVAFVFAACQSGGRIGDPEEGTPLFEFLRSSEVSSFAKNFEKNFPESVGIASFEHSDGGDYIKTSDEETIRAVFEALSEIKVYEKIGDSGTAYYMETVQYIFNLPGDKVIKFGFDDGDLIYKETQRYRIEGYYKLLEAYSYGSD